MTSTNILDEHLVINVAPPHIEVEAHVAVLGRGALDRSQPFAFAASDPLLRSSSMAKGQKRSNKEVRKPKQEKASVQPPENPFRQAAPGAPLRRAS
jgi:hypothetical protein